VSPRKRSLFPRWPLDRNALGASLRGNVGEVPWMGELWRVWRSVVGSHAGMGMGAALRLARNEESGTVTTGPSTRASAATWRRHVVRWGCGREKKSQPCIHKKTSIRRVGVTHPGALGARVESKCSITNRSHATDPGRP